MLLTDLFHAFTGQEHPNRPKPSSKAAGRRAQELQARLLKQRERIASQQNKES